MAVRTGELVLFVLILVIAAATTRWVLIAEAVPLLAMPLWRRSLKRRELGAS